MTRSAMETPPPFTPRLNLLPKRAARRRAHRLRFLLLAGTVLTCTLSMLYALQTLLSAQLTQQEYVHQQLEQQIAAMRHSAIIALTHDATPDDILWLEQWLGRRGQAQRMLEHLARVTPDEVMLTNFRQEDDSCVLSGQAISATAVRQLERALHQDPLCGQQIQQEVLPQALGQRPIQSFTLRFRPGTTEGR